MSSAQRALYTVYMYLGHAPYSCMRPTWGYGDIFEVWPQMRLMIVSSKPCISVTDLYAHMNHKERVVSHQIGYTVKMKC